MYVIKKDLCVSCGLCADECPTGAISPIGPYKIDREKCSDCGQCADCCPVEAIVEEKINENRA
ncbi:MAG: 4Fe-4S binding protein [Syntrophomonadaceae bacterium]|nr:4Fe-4S binding protein [Syntrophomonadaceae bacterium]